MISLKFFSSTFWYLPKIHWRHVYSLWCCGVCCKDFDGGDLS